MKWFIITCRLEGQDEDTLLIIDAADQDHAVRKAERDLRAVGSWSTTTDFYLNYVVQCATRPTILIRGPQS